jgi:hypothetical protein
MGRTLIALYDNPAVLDLVRKELRRKGLEEAEIRTVHPADFREYAVADTEILGIGGVAQPEVGEHEEAIRRGHGLVAVTTEREHLDEAEDILSTLGAKDIKELASQWKTSGWENPKGSVDIDTGEDVLQDSTTQAGRTRGKAGVRVFVW